MKRNRLHNTQFTGARRIPASKTSRDAMKQALDRARKLRETLSLGGLKIKELIEEGRR